jgi:predicted membrane protein
MLRPKFIIGVFLVAMGIVLTLDQFGVLKAHHFLRFWPIALIVLGLVIVQKAEKRSLVRGMVLIVIGVWLLLNTLGLVSLDLWDFFWPLLLVLIGARIMMHSQGSYSNRNKTLDQTNMGAAPLASPQSDPQPRTFNASQSPELDHASLFSLLSSSKRRWGKSVFRGAEASAVLGGCELDLREALLDPSNPPIIDVFVVMGGISILVPTTWTVSQEIAPIMGGVDDNTRTVASLPVQHVTIRGTVLMGGVEIGN